MSAWGNLDNVVIAGTVTAFTTNTQVNGSTTYFTSNVKAGDYIIFGGRKYQVGTVTSDTVLNLTNVAAANIVANVAYVQQGPKYVSNVITLSGEANRVQNVVTIQNIYGVDRLEEAYPSPAANATPHVGWVTYRTYTTSQGATRTKAEVLVAMSKNFNANVTGHLQTDASDDAVYPQ